jgi:hypothetical protein
LSEINLEEALVEIFSIAFLFLFSEDFVMLKRALVSGSLLSLLAVASMAAVFSPSADARKCPRGFEDINDVCVYTGHQ